MKRSISLLLCFVLLAIAALSAGLSVSAVEDEASPELHIPTLVITTENGNGPELFKEDGYVNAHVIITDTDGSVLEDDAQFKVRGNTTAFGPTLKKPFTIKYSKKKNVLGMGKAKKWALLANAYDPTLLRNYTALEFGRTLGVPYTSDQKFAELWLDGSYRGVYTVVEPVEAGDTRVDIDKNFDNGNITDFMIELEARREEEGVTYFKSGGIRFAAKEPEEPDEGQLAYMQGTMDNIINTLQNGSQEEIEAVIDVPSFAAYYVLNEYVRNVDLDYSSVFFFYKNGKLYVGPPWDYDFSMAGQNPSVTVNYGIAARTDGVYANKNLFLYLCEYDWFMDEAKQVYEDNYTYIYNIAREGGMIEELADEYAVEFNNNFTKSPWKVTRWWINYAKQPLATYQANLDFWRDWCFERNLWMIRYFKPFEGEYLIGDADGDGEVNVIDATFIQRTLAGLYPDDDCMLTLRGDITIDGLDVTDATLVQKYDVQMNIPYEIGVPRTYEENET